LRSVRSEHNLTSVLPLNLFWANQIWLLRKKSDSDAFLGPALLTTANVRTTIVRHLGAVELWGAEEFWQLWQLRLNLEQNRELSCWDRTISETSAAPLDEDSDALISVKRLKIVNPLQRRSLPKSVFEAFVRTAFVHSPS